MTLTGTTQSQLDAEAQTAALNETIATNQAYLDSTDWHASYAFETGQAIDATVKQDRINARSAISKAKQQLSQLTVGV
jgi:hypothetical protein